MTSETKPLTGLELRKACLIAAGWTVKNMCNEPDETPCYVPFSPDGKVYYFGEYYLTENDAWRIAPAVESSVDAALEYLTFPPNMQLDLNSPTYNGKLWYVELHFSPSFSPQYYAYEENPAVGICRVWLQWKTA